ncbi:LysR substrate-binding domain-containing protein [Flavisphingomonas formosensis]|uniref:LysR substrate-binding domain-containing protein n=1 Tax=Flavisphingomonas formosensis TaxID=861534 RepID=UPI0012F9AB4B|nr:LysR substrate-binding domain-containing protein [Sphingomonas formosensis]
MLPSVKGLQALAALDRAASLSAAAVALGVTRSALSHRIADLERQLGVTLVRQAGRSAELTDDARALLLVMGDALDRIEAAVEPFRRRRGELRISTVATFASLWLIPRLADWQRRHPAIALAIATSTRPIDFAADDFDCAIRHGFGGWPGLSETLLFRETLLPVARPGVPPLSPASVAIRARSRFRDWHRWWQGAGQAGVPPERGIIVENRGQAMEAVLAGAGVAMMDAAYAAPHLADGSLRALGPTVTLPEGYYLVAPVSGARNIGAVGLLRDWLAEQAA